jgi:hypothetical protein
VADEDTAGIGALTEHDESGVDVSLIHRMLSLSPAERLGLAEAYANFVLETRERNDTGRLSKDSS